MRVEKSVMMEGKVESLPLEARTWRRLVMIGEEP